MARDANATRAKLIREAERLFARRGVWQITVREITEAAGQRNPSVLHYHFGSREGLLLAILAVHGDPIDAGRGAVLASLGPEPSSRQLVGALLVPYGAELDTPEGRDYLRVVAQLTSRFALWRSDDAVPAPNLVRILDRLEAGQAHLPEPIRRHRTVGMIVLMTTAFAERARAIESGEPLDVEHEAFLANLADMMVALLEAPLGPALGDDRLADAFGAPRAGGGG